MNSGLALFMAFGIGVVAGLRSMTAPAIVAWAAHQGWISLSGSHLAFMGSAWAVGCDAAMATNAAPVSRSCFISSPFHICPEFRGRWSRLSSVLGERVQHADALDRPLLYAVDRDRSPLCPAGIAAAGSPHHDPSDWNESTSLPEPVYGTRQVERASVPLFGNWFVTGTKASNVCFTAPGLIANMPVGNFNIEDVKASTDLHLAFNDLTVGKMRFSVGHAAFDSPARADLKGDTRNLTIAAESSVKDDFVNTDVTFSIDSVESPKFSATQLVWEMRMDHIHGPSMAALNKELMAAQAEQLQADMPGSMARLCGVMLTDALIGAGDQAEAEQVCAATLARSRDAGDLWNLSSLLIQMTILDLRAGRIRDAHGAPA